MTVCTLAASPFERAYKYQGLNQTDCLYGGCIASPFHLLDTTFLQIKICGGKEQSFCRVQQIAWKENQTQNAGGK